MTNFDRVKNSKSIEELALVIIKIVDRCAIYFPFVDEDDTEDLKGNVCFENFKKWLTQETDDTGNFSEFKASEECEDDKWLGMTIGDMW